MTYSRVCTLFEEMERLSGDGVTFAHVRIVDLFGSPQPGVDEVFTCATGPGETEERNFVDVVDSGEPVQRIPTTLRDAFDAPAKGEVVKSALPGDLHGIYDWYKHDKLNKFTWETSSWDVKTYLDCPP